MTIDDRPCSATGQAPTDAQTPCAPCARRLQQLSGGGCSNVGAPPALPPATSVRQHLTVTHFLVDGPGPGRVQIWGGLRVRMGIHAGLGHGEAVHNRTAGRMQYTGAVMAAAKDVADGAHGGMVLMTGAAKARVGGVGGL